jgi:molecular chaperone Hsp33
LSVLLPDDNLPGEAGLHVGMAGSGSFRWAATDLTVVVEDARSRLDLSPLAAAALGRALAGSALLLRLASKAPARLVVDFRGDGPLRTVLAEADAEGNLRGMVGSPRASLPDAAPGKLAVGAGIGRGTLRILRELEGSSYASQVEIQTGEVGDDIAHYLEQSAQIRSAVLLGVLAHPGGIAAAGGFLVEVLPGARSEDIQTLEENLIGLRGVSHLIAADGLRGAMDRVFSGLVAEVHETRPLRYRCRCSRERLRGHLVGLPEADREHLRQDDGTCVAECVFCATEYRFTPGELDPAAS